MISTYSPSSFGLEKSDFDELLNELILDLSNSKSISDFSDEVLNFISKQSPLYRAVFYTRSKKNASGSESRLFQVIGAYACSNTDINNFHFELDKGIHGKAATLEHITYYENVPCHEANLGIAGLELRYASIAFLPIVYNRQCFALLELIFLDPLTKEIKNQLNALIQALGGTLETLLSHFRSENLYLKIYRQNEVITKELTAKNQKITDSIRYARSIQEGILPSATILKRVFPEHFVLFLPKDLVSGDFYWFGKTEKYSFLAVADCTGHGVPGAFMSMLGYSFLNQIILESHVESPARILSLLDAKIQYTLKQDSTQNTDGMDLLIARFENECQKEKLTYAGAKSKFYQKTSNEIIYHKSDSRSIGGIANRSKEFKDYTIAINKGDMLYFTTDGYQDSGDRFGKSLGRKNLEKLLLESSKKDLKKQKEYLLNHLLKYVKDAPQRDDITLIGIKI
jgi:serine phosphatase RsbU (regulator of sigma subunit)